MARVEAQAIDAKGNRIGVGSLVRLLSGSGLMTVGQVDDDGEVLVLWADSNGDIASFSVPDGRCLVVEGNPDAA
jgi:uncharacterized protein YodC (DUF2158 family)